MASPPTTKKPLISAGGFFDSLFRGRRRQYSEDGSSRRGRRFWDRGEDYSVGKDSSTHSALFDLELSTRGVRPVLDDKLATQHASHPELHAKLQRVAYLASPVARFEIDLLQDVQAIREVCSKSDGEIDIMQMARELCTLGYACSLQCNDPTAFSSGEGAACTSAASSSNIDSTCLEKLRHTFIVCMGRSDGTVAHYCLVDPQFRDQFRIGQPTEVYEAILGVLPPEFVGSPLRLQALADLLCTEIVEVYREQKLPLPPWRKSAAMLSKWFDVSGSQQQQQEVVQPQPPWSLEVQVPPPQQQQQQQQQESSEAGGVPVGGQQYYFQDDRSLHRGRSGGWSDLAPIQEAPSPHHFNRNSAFAGSSSDLFAGSVGGNSVASTESGRSRGSGKVVSLLARGLSGLKLGKNNKNSGGGGKDSSVKSGKGEGSRRGNEGSRSGRHRRFGRGGEQQLNQEQQESFAGSSF